MRLHRFYINQKVGEQKEITIPDADLSHQVGNVFRLKSGDQVIIFNGTGFEYVSQIISISKKELSLKVLSHSTKASRDKKISLYLSLIKKSNFELAVEKCTELGVDEIHPLISERSEKKDLNLERLNKIAKEASEQSGRVTLPLISEITDLEKAVSQAGKENKVSIVFHTVDNLSEVPPSSANNIAIFIGPEGGWTEKEMELFKKNNFQICSLGQNILRAETAAITSVFQATQTPSH